MLDRAVADAGFLAVSRPAHGGIVLVAIDPPSLRELEVWSWPRGYHATVLENLLGAGASRVAFDVDFSSRSEPEEDAELARALEAARGRAILPVFRHGPQPDDPGAPPSSTGPIPAFARAAVLATINVLPDPDGRVRRYPARGEHRGRPVPTLAAALLGRGPAGSDRPFLIDYGIDPQTIPVLSYVDVLAGRFDPEGVRGRAVLVGSTAIELGDQLAVPRWTSLPGCVVQALAFESMAQHRALAPAHPAWTLVALAAACVVAALAGRRGGWRGGLVRTGTGVALVVLAAWGARAAFGQVVDVAPVALALAGGYVVALTGSIDRQALGLRIRDRRIERSEHLARHVVSNSLDAILTLDRDGAVTAFNRAAREMFGCTEGEARGRHVTEWVPDWRDDDPAPRETEAVRADGRTFPIEIAVTGIVAGAAQRWVVFVRDITERRAQHEALEHQATHDVLTDLPNRNLLQRRVETALAEAAAAARSVAFLLADLNRFKEVNDTLGHPVGDTLLREVARRFRAVMDGGDTIARLGGDEFAALLPGAGPERATRVAHALVRALDEPFRIEGVPLQVDTSVGIALYPEHGADAAALIRRADVAMYAAKRGRTAVAVYDAGQDSTSVRLLSLTGDLRRAMRDGELRLHYQPKMSAATDRPVGVEALARWRHPVHGDVPPEEFVPLAERSGLIRPLTEWVLGTALRQGARWRSEGIELDVSVNLSVRDLLDETLPRELTRMLEASGLPAEALTLEVTESVIMEDPDRALEILTGLHELGIGISIDDFGTGYSSLGYLKTLPADELKIDKTFVRDMDANHDDRAIVRSTIELAHNLGLKVVAEGVETDAIWRDLRRLGCDIGQGYLFSRPVPADRLAAWLAALAPAGAGSAAGS